MAGDSAYGDNGIIQLAENVGFTDENLAGILKIPIEIWIKAKDRLLNHPDPKENRIESIKLPVGFGVKIINWEQYQSEYSRQKPYRKLQGKVTKQSYNQKCGVDIEGDIEGDIKNKYINKKLYIYLFEEIFKKYPNKDGKKIALKHFIASVKTDQDLQDIQKALSNYLNSKRVKEGYIKNGSTWFNNWKDWVNYTEEITRIDLSKEKLLKSLRGEKNE